jgi:hypothetical protein
MGNEGRRSATTAPVAASITASTAKPVSMSNEGKRSETAALTATPTTSISEVIKGIETLFTFGSRSGSKSNFEQLNDSIKSKIINAAKEFKSMTGSTISINSAKRDPEDQQRLWDESVAAGRPGKTAKNMPIGRPVLVSMSVVLQLIYRIIMIQKQ